MFDAADACLVLVLIGLPLALRIRNLLSRRLLRLAIAVAIALLALPVIAEIAARSSPPAGSVSTVVQVPVHVQDELKPTDSITACLVRALLFDLDQATTPVGCASEIALVGEPFRLEAGARLGPSAASPSWILEGTVELEAGSGQLALRYRWSDAGAARTARPRTQYTRLSRIVTLQDGSYAALLLTRRPPRSAGLGLLATGGRSRTILAVLLEPLADGDQVVEVPLASWWDTHRLELLELLGPRDAGDQIPPRPVTDAFLLPLAHLLRHCSIVALALLATGLIILGILIRMPAGTVAAGLILVVVLAAGLDRWKLARSLEELGAPAPERRARGALQLAQTAFFPETAAQALIEAWPQESASSVREAIVAALASTDLPARAPAAQALFAKARSSDPSLQAIARAFALRGWRP
ncbi:MAG: hypothetical protein AB1486_16020 [Planctomycetota bacterium]